MACCQNAIRLRPDYAEAHNNLGNVFKDQNNFEEAQRCYEHAVGLNPKYGPGLNNLGVIYREQGRMPSSRLFSTGLCNRPQRRPAHQAGLGDARRAGIV